MDAIRKKMQSMKVKLTLANFKKYVERTIGKEDND